MAANDDQPGGPTEPHPSDLRGFASPSADQPPATWTPYPPVESYPAGRSYPPVESYPAGPSYPTDQLYPQIRGGYPPAKPPAMPDGPREFAQLLRGPRHRWWKPLLSIGMFVALVVILINVLSLLLIPIGLLTGHQNLAAYVGNVLDSKNLGPLGFAFTNLSLIILIPCAMFSIWAVHRTKPRFLISVEGRFRWRWFARCLVILVPLWLIYLGVGTALDPPTGGRPPHWLVLMIIVVISTPLQAAGEEFAFRGFLTQTIGSWFRRPIVSVLVPLPFSVGLFALAHGSLHLWVLVDLGSFALATYVLAWRTGGLEAGIALHAVNNVLLMLLSLNLGGWQQGFVQSDTTGSPGSALISLGVNAAVTVIILWQAKRIGLRRIYRPEVKPVEIGYAPAPPAWVA